MRDRLAHLFGRGRLDRALADEMHEHLQEKIDELIEAGVEPHSAEIAARRQFGNLTAVAERSRDAWSFPTLESIAKDVRYGLRSLKRRPGFTAVIALTLGLGIGANAAIFGLIDGLWFHPMGATQPNRIARVFSVTSQDREGSFSFPEYRALAEQATGPGAAFQGLVACGRRGVRITASDGTHELLLVNVVSENFFETLGVQAAVGGLFEGSQDRPVVVLGYTFWQRHFGGDPGVSGKTLHIERGDRSLVLTILGALPSSFRDIDTGADRDLWIPSGTGTQIYGNSNFSAREFRWFKVLGRLAPGVSAESARSRIQTIAHRFAQDWPASNTGRSATVVADLEYRLRQTGTNGIALISIALLVVLLCCVNVANLLIAGNLGRRTEFAVRLALGVDRLRLARQLMTENALLGIAGLALGLAFGGGLIRLLPALFVPPPGISGILHFAFDGRVLAFAITIAVLAIVLFGLAPVWRASNVDPGPTLKGAATVGGLSQAGYRLRRWLVVAQVSISLVLLTASGVLVESLVNARSSKSGLTQRPLLLAWLGGTGKLPDSTYRQAVERLCGLPGVTDVAFATRAPLSLSGGGYAQRVSFPGRTDPEARTPIEVKFNSISSNFLRLIGTPVIRGREFNDMDQTSGPLSALINERMAQRFWPGEDPIGKAIRLVDQKNAEFRVAGIVKNAPVNEIGEAPEPYIYLPFWRNPTDEVTLFVSAGSDPMAIAQPVRTALMSIDARLEPYITNTLADLIRYSTVRYQITAELVSALGLLALLITAVGLYGVVSFNVNQRVREMGIRMALGAEQRQTLALVLREVGKLAVWGMLIGLPCALMATRLAAALLFGVGPWDVPAFLTAVVLLSGVLLVAGLGPARRATKIEPMSALRYE